MTQCSESPSGVHWRTVDTGAAIPFPCDGSCKLGMLAEVFSKVVFSVRPCETCGQPAARLETVGWSHIWFHHDLSYWKLHPCSLASGTLPVWFRHFETRHTDCNGCAWGIVRAKGWLSHKGQGTPILLVAVADGGYRAYRVRRGSENRVSLGAVVWVNDSDRQVVSPGGYRLIADQHPFIPTLFRNVLDAAWHLVPPRMHPLRPAIVRSSDIAVERR